MTSTVGTGNFAPILDPGVGVPGVRVPGLYPGGKDYPAHGYCLCTLEAHSRLWYTRLPGADSDCPGTWNLPYGTQYCFRARNRALGPDFGRILVGKAD